MAGFISSMLSHKHSLSRDTTQFTLEKGQVLKKLRMKTEHVFTRTYRLGTGRVRKWGGGGGEG